MNPALPGLILGLLVGAIGLAGCSTPEPLIDRINVSDAKYNRDLTDCRQSSRSGWIPFTGTSLDDCMRGKGYKVLMGTSGL